MTDTKPIIEISNVSKLFGSLRALVVRCRDGGPETWGLAPGTLAGLEQAVRQRVTGGK